MPWEDGAEEEVVEPAKPGAGKDEVKLSRAEHTALVKERDEARASEKYWSERARTPSRAAEPEAEPAEEPEEDDEDADIVDDTPDKFTDDLTANGRNALQKRGYRTAKQVKGMIAKAVDKALNSVDSRVNARVTAAHKQMLDDAELTRAFPDLLDEHSELSQRTAEEYRALVKEDPALKNSRVALKTAAKLAKASLAPKVDEEARRRRIAAQSGGRDYFPADTDDDNLSPFQKNLIAKFNADGGVQISEDAYRKRAKKGVSTFGKDYQPGTMNW